MDMDGPTNGLSPVDRDQIEAFRHDWNELVKSLDTGGTPWHPAFDNFRGLLTVSGTSGLIKVAPTSKNDIATMNAIEIARALVEKVKKGDAPKTLKWSLLKKVGD
jgi:hypothetical protein